MFHPLYYKMFHCTRKYCKAAPYCPFYHAEEEKKIWGEQFLKYINKERVSYVKEKKKSSTLSSTDDSFSLSPKSDVYCKTPGENRGAHTPLSIYSSPINSVNSAKMSYNRRPLGRMDKIEKYCPVKYPAYNGPEGDDFSTKNVINEQPLTNYPANVSAKNLRRTFVNKKLIKEIRVS